MARRAAEDTSYLEKRGKQWWCIRDIPTGLKSHFLNKDGKPRKRLIECLKTSDLAEARRRRPAALALFESKFEAARAKGQGGSAAAASALSWYESIIAAATEQRDLLHRLQRGDTRGVYVDKYAPVAGESGQERALSIAQFAIEQQAVGIADEYGEEAERAYLEVVTGEAPAAKTPAAIEPLVGCWLEEEDIEPRSKGDHRRAVNELLKWAKDTNRQGVVSQFDRKTAGQYVTHLLGTGLDRSKSVAKRLWSLSALWRYLIAKDLADANVWIGHNVGRNGRSSRDKHPERPFTAAEVQKLLNGAASPELADLMRMALFSGARIEELCLLRVADIDPAEKTMRIAADPKSPASRRLVPIHSATWPIIERRINGKPADSFVLHELGPAPQEGRQRSMPISKAFGRYRANVGVEDKAQGQRRSLVNFHSFRRTFVTLAEQADQPESTIRSVVGHKRSGMTFGLYSGGPSLEQRRACVEAVVVPLVPDD